MKENEIVTLCRTETSTLRSVCAVQFRDRKRAKDLMLMLDLNEIIEQFAMVNNMC